MCGTDKDKEFALKIEQLAVDIHEHYQKGPGGYNLSMQFITENLYCMSAKILQPEGPQFRFIAIDQSINPVDLSEFVEGKTEDEIYDSLLTNERFRKIIFFPTSENIDIMIEKAEEKIHNREYRIGDILYIGSSCSSRLNYGFGVVTSCGLDISDEVVKFNDVDEEDEQELTFEELDYELHHESIPGFLLRLRRGSETITYGMKVVEDLTRFYSAFLTTPEQSCNDYNKYNHLFIIETEKRQIYEWHNEAREMLWYTTLNEQLETDDKTEKVERLSSKYMKLFFPKRSSKLLCD